MDKDKIEEVFNKIIDDLSVLVKKSGNKFLKEYVEFIILEKLKYQKRVKDKDADELILK